MVELSWNMVKDWKWNVFQHFVSLPFRRLTCSEFKWHACTEFPDILENLCCEQAAFCAFKIVSKSGFWIWDCSNTAFCCWRHSNHRDYIVALLQDTFRSIDVSKNKRVCLMRLSFVVVFCPGIRHSRSRKMWRRESSGYEGKKRRTCGRRPGRSITPGLATDKNDQKWHGCRKDTNLNPVANCTTQGCCAVPFRLPKDSWWTTACSTLGPMELATVWSSDLERFKYLTSTIDIFRYLKSIQIQQWKAT